MVECIVPILNVRDLEVSIEYYVNTLGFRKQWESVGEEYAMAGIVRGGCSIYLCRGAQGQAGTWVWVGVEDVEAMHRELIASGASIRHPPRNYPWAKEMRVEDPDGHVLRIASESDPDRPYDPFLP